MDVFNEHMPTPNQIHVKREGDVITQKDLLAVPAGTITEAGLRMNINVGILYIESWLRGVGAAALHNLMEDAATAEISRTQVWQWIRSKSKLEDGRLISAELYNEILPSEIENIKSYVGAEAFEKGRFTEAIEIFSKLVLSDDYVEFLTLPAYELIS
jgi:malate synthase